MRVRFNSFANLLTLDSILHCEWIALILINKFLIGQSIDSTLPVIEFKTSFNRLLIKFDDTRFKIYNKELQLNLFYDFIEILNFVGFGTISEIELDQDIFFDGNLVVEELNSNYDWFKRTETYPQLFSVPKHIEYHQEYTKEYFIKFIGLWDNDSIQNLMANMKPKLAKQCTIKGTEFCKYLIVSEVNVNHKETFLDMQIFVVDKEQIMFEEFGDYRFFGLNQKI